MGTSLLPEELMNFSWPYFKMATHLILSFCCCLWIYRGIEHGMGKDSARSLPLLFCLRRAQLYPLRLCHPSSTIPGGWDILCQITPQATWSQCFTALPVQKRFLTSSLNLPQWHVRLLFFVVSNVNTASRLLPSSLRQQIFMFEGYCRPPPQSSLLSAEQPNFCQSFKTANHSYCSPLDPFQIIHIFLKATGVARHPL